MCKDEKDLYLKLGGPIQIGAAKEPAIEYSHAPGQVSTGQIANMVFERTLFVLEHRMRDYAE